MKTKYKILLILILIIVLIAPTIVLAQGIIDASGYDTDMDYSDDYIVVTTGPLSSGKWVGCSIFTDDEVIDIPPQKNTGVIEFGIPDDVPPGRHKVTVALWKKIVENCGCYYCRKNGCHLEGEVDRKNFYIIK